MDKKEKIVTATFTNNENNKKAVITITDGKDVSIRFIPSIINDEEAEDYARFAAYFTKILTGE